MESLTQNTLHTAIKLRESGHYLEAIEWIKKYLIQNSQDAEAYAHLAQIFSLNKQEDDAWNALNSALAINPSSILVQRNHARLLLKQQKISEARQIAIAIYQTDSTDIENQLVLAATLVANNELEPAKNLCELVLQKNPNYAEAFAILGQIHLKLGNKIAVLQLFEKALSIKPHLTPLYGITISLHKENKNLPAAIHTLQKALKYEPHNIGYMVALGEFLLQNYQPNEAIEILEKVVQLAPETVGAWTNLGNAFQQKNEFTNAKLAYEKALVIDPNQAELLNNIGIMTENDKNWEAALEYFEKALIIQPERVVFMVNQASVLNNLGHYEDAEYIVKKALENDVQSDQAHYVLASTFQNRNRLPEANASYLKALEIKSNLEKATLALAINYYLLLDYSCSHDFLKRSLSVLNRPKLKEFEANKNYVIFISRLLNWWEIEIKNTGLIFNEQNHGLPILSVVGESHSLAAHRTNFEIDKKTHRCHTQWLRGIKMWDLAQTKFNPMQQRVTQILSELPCDMPVMFTIGEIDCRLDEGIWKTAKKKSKNHKDLVTETVTGYLNWLENTLKNTGHKCVIIQGIPAPNYPLDENENIGIFLEMIAEVNQQLMFHSFAKGWQFLDVYAATTLENGKSNQQWHLDEHHLKPSFYAQAHKWLKSI